MPAKASISLMPVSTRSVITILLWLAGFPLIYFAINLNDANIALGLKPLWGLIAAEIIYLSAGTASIFKFTKIAFGLFLVGGFITFIQIILILT